MQILKCFLRISTDNYFKQFVIAITRQEQFVLNSITCLKLLSATKNTNRNLTNTVAIFKSYDWTNLSHDLKFSSNENTMLGHMINMKWHVCSKWCSFYLWLTKQCQRSWLKIMTMHEHLKEISMIKEIMQKDEVNLNCAKLNDFAGNISALV